MTEEEMTYAEKSAFESRWTEVFFGLFLGYIGIATAVGFVYYGLNPSWIPDDYAFVASGGAPLAFLTAYVAARVLVHKTDFKK